MIRQALSQALTDELRQILPAGAGDKWGNPDFTVIFNDIEIDEYSNPVDENGLFDTVCALQGRIMVQVRTDAEAPLDLTETLISLFTTPLQITPDESVPPGTIQVQMLFKPNRMRDLVLESAVVPELWADLEYCYILKRNEQQLFRVGSNLAVGEALEIVKNYE